MYRYMISVADVKMDIPGLVLPLKSSILSSTSLQLNDIFWGMLSAAVERLRRKANKVAQGHGKCGPGADPIFPPKQT